MLAWWDDDLLVLEVHPRYGGRAVTLASQMHLWPGRLEVFAADFEGRWPEWHPRGAVRMMRRLCGMAYGWKSVLWVAMRHLPILRWVLRPELDDQLLGPWPPFCSQACVVATRLGGGVDPVPHLADRFTEPADLARSPFYSYRFTLGAPPSEMF